VSPSRRSRGWGEEPKVRRRAAPHRADGWSPCRSGGVRRQTRGRLENQLSDLIFPPKANAANERLAQHLWTHRDDLFTFLRQPGLDATNWRAELAIRFGVILRKVWGGSRTWVGAGAQARLGDRRDWAWQDRLRGSAGLVPPSSLSISCQRRQGEVAAAFEAR
jgi:hypothetical protein